MKIIACEQGSKEWYAARAACIITASEMGPFCAIEIAVTVDKLKADLKAANIAFKSDEGKDALLSKVPDLSVYWGYSKEAEKARKRHIREKIAEVTGYPDPADVEGLSDEARAEFDRWERENAPAKYWLRRQYEAQEKALKWNPAVQLGKTREADARRDFSESKGHEIEEVGFIIHSSGRFGASPDGLLIHDDIPSRFASGYESKCPLPETHLAYLDDPKQLVEDYKAQIHGNLIVTEVPVWNVRSWCPPYPPVDVTVARTAWTKQLERGLLDLAREYDETWNRVLVGDVAKKEQAAESQAA